MKPDQEFGIERVESCCQNKGPHDRIKKGTEDDAQLPREQEQNAEKGGGTTCLLVTGASAFHGHSDHTYTVAQFFVCRLDTVSE